MRNLPITGRSVSPNRIHVLRGTFGCHDIAGSALSLRPRAAYPDEVAAHEESDISSLRAERDLYRKLLELGSVSELEPFVRDALELVTRVCNARCGYVELRHESSPGMEVKASFGLNLSSEDLDVVRQMISRGVIAEAMASGRTVETASA